MGHALDPKSPLRRRGLSRDRLLRLDALHDLRRWVVDCVECGRIIQKVCSARNQAREWRRWWEGSDRPCLLGWAAASVRWRTDGARTTWSQSALELLIRHLLAMPADVGGQVPALRTGSSGSTARPRSFPSNRAPIMDLLSPTRRRSQDRLSPAGAPPSLSALANKERSPRIARGLFRTGWVSAGSYSQSSDTE
jgi:hypothetical protein